MTKKTVGYIRVSTSKQMDGNGPEQQRASIVAWAAANGIPIDDWVTEDESGTKEDREEILRLLKAAEAGELGTLIIDRTDRLGRRLVVSESLFARFTKFGVEVICTQMKLDNTPTGILMRQFMGAIAEFQRSEWLARMRSCRRLAIARKGRFGGGVPPYGYKCARDGQLEIDPETAPIVRRVFALEGHTLHAIAETLANEGFRTRVGTRFQPTQIRRILERASFYRGLSPLQEGVEYDEDVVPTHPAILTGDDVMHATEHSEKAPVGEAAGRQGDTGLAP